MLLMTTRLADALNAALEAKGINKYQLAKATGVSEGMISYYFSGTKVPSDKTIARISKGLDTDPQPLMDLALMERLGPEKASRVVVLEQPKATEEGTIGTNVPAAAQASGRREQASIMGTDVPRGGTYRALTQGDVSLPVYGPASCGEMPMWSLDDPLALRSVDLPIELIGEGRAVFIAHGTSMEGLRIQSGDWLVAKPLDSDQKPTVGKKVIIEYQGAFCCKVYREDSSGRPFLESHPASGPELFLLSDDVRIVGQVVRIILEG